MTEQHLAVQGSLSEKGNFHVQIIKAMGGETRKTLCRHQKNQLIEVKNEQG